MTLTLFRWPSHAILLNLILHIAVQTPKVLLLLVWPLPRSLATTSGISVDFSSSPYLDVSVQAVPHVHLCIQCTLTEYCSAGFPHSEIHGSLPAFDFPWLIVDRYVLHRLPMPRHPPCALLSLTFSELCVLMFVNFSTRLYCSIFTHLTIVKSFEYLLHYLVVSISHYLYSVFKVHLQAFRLVWWAQEDSNLRPHAYQACALTT